jgi:hypothetical protein
VEHHIDSIRIDWIELVWLGRRLIGGCFPVVGLSWPDIQDFQFVGLLSACCSCVFYMFGFHNYHTYEFIKNVSNANEIRDIVGEYYAKDF